MTFCHASSAKRKDTLDTATTSWLKRLVEPPLSHTRRRNRLTVRPLALPPQRRHPQQPVEKTSARQRVTSFTQHSLTSAVCYGPPPPARRCPRPATAARTDFHITHLHIHLEMLVEQCQVVFLSTACHLLRAGEHAKDMLSRCQGCKASFRLEVYVVYATQCISCQWCSDFP